MRTRNVNKKRVHEKTPASREFRVIVQFANSKGDGVSALLAAFKDWMPRVEFETLRFDLAGLPDASPTKSKRLRDDIRAALKILNSGDEREINLILTRLDEVAPRRIHSLWSEQDAARMPFVMPEIRKIKLGDNNYCAVSSYPLHRSLRQLIYAMLRESIFADQIGRLGQCKVCQNFTVRQRRDPDFCSDPCRWNFNNHKPERKKHYIKGKWYR